MVPLLRLLLWRSVLPKVHKTMNLTQICSVRDSCIQLHFIQKLIKMFPFKTNCLKNIVLEPILRLKSFHVFKKRSFTG
ncbi:hypothetical protein KUF71_023793 [Frankliniella fusca]|uniref:Uncharacterized protein n=1 Tax=Frankliniella fusca TaxID=407009 RepID=A0AAE1H4F6_9NEOP|nr:hypothetical protein KUF71_023793 [Frankliniella fusca]